MLVGSLDHAVNNLEFLGAAAGTTLVVDTAAGVTLGTAGGDAVNAGIVDVEVRSNTTFGGELIGNNLRLNAGTYKEGATAANMAVNGAITFTGQAKTANFSLATSGSLTAAGAVTLGSTLQPTTHTINGTLNATTADTITFAGDTGSGIAFSDTAKIRLGDGSDTDKQIDFGGIATTATGKATVATTGTWATDNIVFANTAFTAANFDTIYDQFIFGRAKVLLQGNNVIFAGYGTMADTLGVEFQKVGLPISANKLTGLGMVDRTLAGIDPAGPLATGINDTSLDIIAMVIDPARRAAGLRATGQALGEYGSAAHQALQTTTTQFQSALDRRLEFNLDFHAAEAAAASGNGYASLDGWRNACGSSSSVWAELNGGWAKQKAKSDIDGYDYDGYGVTLGYERRIDRLLLGFGGGYTRAGVDVDNLATKYDADVMNLGLYAAYFHDTGLVARMGLGFGYAWNDYDVAMALGPNKSGKYSSQSYTASADLGYAFRAGPARIIPSVGVRYGHYRQEGWTEAGGQLGTRGFFDKSRRNVVDIPVQVRVAGEYAFGCVRVAPEARAAWIYTATKKNSPGNRTGYGRSSMAAAACVWAAA